MGEKKRVFFLIIAILMLSTLLMFVMDRIGIIQVSDYIPYLEDKNPKKLTDKDFPSEVEKLGYEKKKDKLVEWEEKLAQQDEKLKNFKSDLGREKREIDEMKTSLDNERKRIRRNKSLWNDRTKKVADLAEKVGNMPPATSVKMMENWSDFDIIDVIRAMDKKAEDEGVVSITSYLLSLFSDTRRAEITRKMLLPPLQSSEDDELAESDNNNQTQTENQQGDNTDQNDQGNTEGSQNKISSATKL